MRTALLISGLPRFSADFDSQLENLQNSEIDWYVVLWSKNIVNDPKLSSNWREVETIDDARSLIEPYMPSHHAIKHIEFLNPEEYSILPRDYQPMNSNPFNVWQQYNILKVCDQRRKESGIIYDLVIRSRPDVGLNKPLDLVWIRDQLRSFPNSIFMPDNFRFGYDPGFCDQFAVGLPYVMGVYCEAINYFDNLYEQGIYYNPECLLQTVINFHGIEYPKTGFEISRGGHWTPIEHGRWGQLTVAKKQQI
jgi:hypothetical protein